MYKCMNCGVDFKENEFSERFQNRLCSEECRIVLLHNFPGTQSITIDEVKDTSLNNGGSTDYYKIFPEWLMAQDIIESRDMNYAQGNIFKAAFTFNTSRHTGTDYERELNKIIYFVQRELERIKGESK